MRSSSLLSLLLLSLIVSTAFSHDYWLQSKKSPLAIGQSTSIQLFVGDHFQPQSERPFQAKMTPKLELRTRGGVVDLAKTCKEGQKPLVSVPGAKSGGHLIVLERDWSFIELEAEKFNNYLDHEGLSDALAQRRKSGEAGKPARERYRRYLKTLVQVGESRDETFRQEVGQRLEILPLDDPTAPNSKKPVTVSVRFDGKPLANAAIFAYRRLGDKVTEQPKRTDSKGLAQFKVDGSGLWMFRLVHIRRVKDDPKVDWESFWAAYSFHR